MGGPNSGRRVDPVKVLMGNQQPAPTGGDTMFLPNVSAIKPEAVKQNPIDIAATGQWTLDGNDIYNSNSGNVGVGMTNPAVTLNVQKQTGSITEMRVDAPGQTTLGRVIFSAFSTGSSSTGGFLSMRNGGTGDENILLRTYADSWWDVPGKNFGIGTKNPAELLTISGGNLNVVGTTNRLVSNGNSFSIKKGRTSSVNRFNVQISGDAGLMLMTDGTDKTRVVLGALAGTKSYINNLGKFGLNTSVPDFTLDVSGAISGISLSGINVTSGADPGHTHTGASITEADPVFLGLSGAFWTDGSTNTGTNKTLDSFTNHVEADEIHEELRNESGDAMTRGDAVYISGFSVGQVKALVTLSDNQSPATMPAVAILEDASLANNATGHFIENGSLQDVDTSMWTAGDALYISGAVSTGLTLTSVRPTGADTQVQRVAVVLRSHASNGVIEIFGAGRVNDVPNSILISGDISGANLWASSNVSGATMFVSGDHTASGAALVVGMITHTSPTPPTASGYAQGTLYVQYTA